MKRVYSDNLMKIHLLSEKQGEMFYEVARAIEKKFAARKIKQLNGLDEIYWDYEYLGKEFCLHYQCYLGVYLIALTPSANPLVEEIAAYLEKDWKERGIWGKLGYK